jgi:hypothetical protein
VKIDASIHIESGHSGADMRLRLVRDGNSSDSSLEQRFALAPYGGSPSALTWVVELPSGIPETFRVILNHPIANPACVNFNSCPGYNVKAALSAITAPFGAHGTKTLD